MTINLISTHTLRGERDKLFKFSPIVLCISTHTLRGERDSIYQRLYRRYKFQLTRSVGSVTKLFKFSPIVLCISTHTLRGERDAKVAFWEWRIRISTHTLRGERDKVQYSNKKTVYNFNSHAPWGA